jgi:hypothetical protein
MAAVLMNFEYFQVLYFVFGLVGSQEYIVEDFFVKTQDVINV